VAASSAMASFCDVACAYSRHPLGIFHRRQDAIRELSEVAEPHWTCTCFASMPLNSLPSSTSIFVWCLLWHCSASRGHYENRTVRWQQCMLLVQPWHLFAMWPVLTQDIPSGSFTGDEMLYRNPRKSLNLTGLARALLVCL